jgi:drug/metabolite transporter (DMT)-like permease
MRLAAVEFGALPTAAVRVSIATLCLLPPVWWRGQLPELRAHWKHVFFVGLLNSGIPFACLSFALLSITTGLSSILNATVPMFGALVAWLWLKDRPNGSRIAGLVIGFAGVALLAWRTTGPGASLMPGADSAAVALAVAACVTACICYATSASYARRFLPGVSPLVMAAGSQLGATLGLALPAALLWPAVAPSATAWLALLAVGVVCTGLAYVLFFRLIANAGPPRALSVTFLVPVFAVLYGVVFLGEQITPWMVLCALIIVCGTALSTGLLSLKRHR